MIRPVWKELRDSPSVKVFFAKHFEGNARIGDRKSRLCIDEHVIWFGYKGQIQARVEQLESVAHLSMSICPVVVDVHIDDARDAAVWTRYSAYAGESLRRFEQASTQRLSAFAVERLERDLAALIRGGYFHPKALDTQQLLIAARSGGLVVDDWTALENDEGHQQLAELDDQRLERLGRELQSFRSRSSHPKSDRL